MMHALQMVLFGAFAALAVLAFYFQLRASMKSGKSGQTEDPAAVPFLWKARNCAIAAAVLLVACMVLGAFTRALG